MNALLNHEAAAHENLNDRAAWLALVDHHTEALEVPYRVALRAVAAMRRKARRDKEVEAARKYFATDHPALVALASCIRCHIYEVEAWSATIVIIPGRKHPRCHINRTGLSHAHEPISYITVGARYVLRLAAIWRASQFLTHGNRGGILSELFTR